MKKYKVTGTYVISFEIEVEADSEEEAEQLGYEFSPEQGVNGCVFTYDGELSADGTADNIEVELIEDDEDDEDEEETEDDED